MTRHPPIMLGLTLFLALTVLVSGGCGKEVPTVGDNNLTLYAAGYGRGVFKSENSGLSWYLLDMNQDPIHAYFKKIYQDPGHSHLIYVTTTGAGLFVIDEQKGWLEQAPDLPGSVVTTFALQGTGPGNGISFMAGLHDEGLYAANDLQGPWSPLHQGLAFRRVNTILSRDDNLLLAGTDQELFRWDRERERWLAASEGIENKNILSLEAGPQAQFILAGAGVYKKERGLLQRFRRIPCLYKSLDKGLTWQVADKGLPKGALVYSIAISQERGQRAFLGTSEGVFSSRNSGQSWQRETDGLPEDIKIFDMKMVRVADGLDIVYAAGSKGVFMKMDGTDMPWLNRSYGLGRTTITGLVVSHESARSK